MSESEQDLEEADQLFVCPYDSTHSRTIARMGHHLTECRENFSISEKAICPFNDKHAIFAPEMDYHKLVCPDKPTEREINHGNANKCDADGENPTKRLFGSFSSGTTFSFSSCETTATGCESGLHLVGGIRNCDSFIGETDESGTITFHSDPELTPNGEKQQPQNGLNGDCRDMGENDILLAKVELKSPIHNISIEKQLEQSESDTAPSGTNSSVGTNERISEEERFDYTKYIPSKDLREDFLKLIGQPRNGQVQETKYEVLSHPYTIQQWPPGYSFLPAHYQAPNGFQSPGVQPAFIPFSSTYNVIPAVSPQAPYTTSYSFYNHSLSPGGFLQTTGQEYNYNVYPPSRPSYHRPYYRRRNNFNSNSSRYNYHKNYTSNNHENHTQTLINGLCQSEISLDESSCYLNKLNGMANHSDVSKSHTMCYKNGFDHSPQPMLSPKLSHNGLKMDETDTQQQFVDIGGVSDKVQFGDAKTNGQEKYCSSIQDDIKKSENDKQIRKIKKKLAEINCLEEKRRQGTNLDCDQLKKLSRKSEFEDQLQSLNLS